MLGAFLLSTPSMYDWLASKPLQLSIRKIELYSPVPGQQILINIVINNLTSSQLTMKAYDVTALIERPVGVEEEMRTEDYLFNRLMQATNEVRAISTDIPPSPPSYYFTLKGDAVSHEQKKRLDDGEMVFYFLGALIHPGGTTFYCNYAEGNGVIKLCRKHNSSS